MPKVLLARLGLLGDLLDFTAAQFHCRSQEAAIYRNKGVRSIGRFWLVLSHRLSTGQIVTPLLLSQTSKGFTECIRNIHRFLRGHQNKGVRMEKDKLSIAQAALRLGLTYQQVRAKLLAGELDGGEDERGRFYVVFTPEREGDRAPEGSEL